jgi:hypothetical protein
MENNMAVLGELLFFRRDQMDLDTVLRNQGDRGLQQAVDDLPNTAFSKHNDELVALILTKSQISPLVVRLEDAKSGVEEVQVDITDIFGERARVKGLRATKAIPFSGDADLWHLRPNQYDFNPPRAEVRGKTIVIGMEVREQEADQAVAHIDSTITKIHQYIQRQEDQLSVFNTNLPAQILPRLEQRRGRLGTAADLLKKLQG